MIYASCLILMRCTFIKSKDNPADLGTKFEKFQNTYKFLGDDSLFRRGTECLRLGIEEAVKQNELIPISKISPTTKEKDLAALEIVKLHQLVITENQEERLIKTIEPSDALAIPTPAVAEFGLAQPQLVYVPLLLKIRVYIITIANFICGNSIHNLHALL